MCVYIYLNVIYLNLLEVCMTTFKKYMRGEEEWQGYFDFLYKKGQKKYLFEGIYIRNDLEMSPFFWEGEGVF